jgi:hypothetical protein
MMRLRHGYPTPPRKTLTQVNRNRAGGSFDDGGGRCRSGLQNAILMLAG